MIVCVCKNINEDKIINEIENGLTPVHIVKKFECTICAKCVPYIKELYTEGKILE